MINVLVVDDDFRVAGLHGEYIAKIDGFRVVGTAHTATEAERMVDELAPDLVLLDLYLPDEHGLALLGRILNRPPPHPDVIVVTAARDVDSVRRAIQHGAVHYLVKPFRFSILRERLLGYQEMRVRLSSLADADQADVDAVYRSLRPQPVLPPKGHSAPTMIRVREVLEASQTDMSAADLAEAVGVSRPTAQRYLSQLERQGLVELHLRYGATGRPEHRYRRRTASSPRLA